MTLEDVFRDMFQGCGIVATSQRLAFYVQVIQEAAPTVSPEQLAAACRDAARETQRAAPSPRDVLAALAKAAPSAAPDAHREERWKVARQVQEAMEDASSRCAIDGEQSLVITQLSGARMRARIAWLEVQSRRPGMWGEISRILLDRERRHYEEGLREDERRMRDREQLHEWRDRADMEPPPPSEAA